ncbi:phage gateway protein [Klebsiella oxytoca]|uniref:phage gateway protein n=1 Tax=Klebsiella oxytoca TaxID=571 RepID=UPI001EEACEAD|nr:hypothetical protein [Klebsiella oxytoca]
MTDNQLFSLLRTSLLAEFTLMRGLVPEVRKAYQPEPEGIPLAPALYLHKIADMRVGFPGFREEMDTVNQVMRQITTQVMIATFQVSATVLTDDADPQALTAPDLLKRAAMIMQSREFQASVIAAGANFLRVGQIQSVDVSGDYAGREIQPFFEFSVNHKDESVREIPFVTRTGYRIVRI